jgi:glycosyltransferase involved in cell wall biosynthesis
MRIAFLCFGAFGGGGVNTYARELLNGIAAAGHSVTLLSSPPPQGITTRLNPKVVLATVAVPALPLVSAPIYGLRLPLTFRRVEKECGTFDIVHSNGYGDALLPRFASKGIRVTTVQHLATSTVRLMGLSLRDMLSHPSSEYGPALTLEGMCLKRAHHLIAASEFTRDEILRSYPDIRPSQISVIYHGSRSRRSEQNQECIERLKRTWGINENSRILLYVGRLEERKGTSFLMEAFALVKSQTDTRLLLVGSGGNLAYERLARRLEIADRVIFAGSVDETSLSAAYEMASVLVHPASIEGFGLTVADALASGLPVVATRVGSIPELVREGIDGFLSGPGDPRAFANSIERVLESPASPSRWTLNDSSSRFSWEKTVRDTLNLYERVLTTVTDD